VLVELLRDAPDAHVARARPHELGDPKHVARLLVRERIGSGSHNATLERALLGIKVVLISKIVANGLCTSVGAELDQVLDIRENVE
jgi:hypothetical protein